MSAQPAESTFGDKALNAVTSVGKGIGAGVSKASELAADKIKQASGQTILKILKYTNIVTAVLLFITYPVGWIVNTPMNGLPGFFLSIYCMFFSIIILVFELNISKVQPIVRKYFGFMFTFRGRTLFILFIASMAFGASYWLNYVSGIIGLLVAFFNCFVTWKHPAFQKGGEFYKETIESLNNKPAVAAEGASSANYEPPKMAASVPQANPFTDDEPIPAAAAPKSSYQPSKPTQVTSAAAPSDNPFDDDF